jgi:hypothetical protein
MLGNLSVRGFIRNPKAFYCPSATFPGHIYPDAWNGTSEKRIGYMYRIIGQRADPEITQAVVDDFAHWKIGRPGGMRALAADILGQRGSMIHWPHQKPWGLNVAYNDGHGSFVELKQSDADKCALQFYTGGSPYAASVYMYLFFKGADNGDFTELRQRFP